MTCKDCKHWHKWGNDKPIGECMKVDYLTDKDRRDKTTFGIEVFVHDDSGLQVDIVTGEDFGCIHFTGKQ